uniref:Uncharacterized protein n=1 Tax=Corvus moneduloides TaxID=1196302 RepID=A0A8U7NIT5_CORMO
VFGVQVAGSISSSLQFHFLQTLEHRTDVSVTSDPGAHQLPALLPCPTRGNSLCLHLSVEQ